MKICAESGKRCYTSKRAALLCNRHVHNAIRAYRCEACNQWHVTHRHA